MAEIQDTDRPYQAPVWDALRRRTTDSKNQHVPAMSLFRVVGDYVRANQLPHPTSGTIRRLVVAAGYPYTKDRHGQRFEGLALKEARP